MLDCSADASDACKADVCGAAPSTWVLTCESDGVPVTWASCD